MAVSITLKNVPDDLRLELKGRAARNGRSLNQEILQLLRAAATLAPNPRSVEAELAAARKHRLALKAAGVWITDADVNRFKREGRP
ncbi:MAG: FitA-like ribbon-helix-helix domain-containing protein [Terriglobales bacterium]